MSLSEAKSHLRVDFVDDDDYITSLIHVARDFAEGFQKKSIVGHTVELTQDFFSREIRLEKGPVKSVTSVKYVLEDGSEVVIDPLTYLLTVDDKIVPKQFWPASILQKVDGVRVTYETGEAIVPPATKHAILLLVGNWYENREPAVLGKTVANIPFTVESLLWMDRRA